MGDRERMLSRRWRHVALGLVVWAAAGAGALAFGPADVVDDTPYSERALRQAAAVARAERALEASSAGTTARLTARPSLAYGADIEDPAAWGVTATLGLELGWRYDRVAVLTDAAALLAEREDLRQARRRDVLDALRLHGNLLTADVAVRRAELDLAGRRPGSLEAERARLLVERRRHRLADLQQQARALGFVSEARFEAVAFDLPAAGDAPPEAARLRLELEAAKLERDAASFDVLRELTLDASYESKTDGYQLQASFGLDRGRPSAGLEGELGPQQDDQWSLALNARIVVDGDDADRRAAADERLRRARAALDAALAGQPSAQARARTAVDDARALLALELDAWRRAATDAASADTDAAVRRACLTLLTRENAAYRAWLGLVGATFDYLETVDGGWRIAPSQTPSPPARPAACTALAGGG